MPRKGLEMINLQGRDIPRNVIANMTEFTQFQMFGEVIAKRYNHSIHPNSRKTAALNTIRRKITSKGKDYVLPAGTEPPLTRPGKDFPGGRSLRRSLRRLRDRQNTTPKNGRSAGSMTR